MRTVKVTNLYFMTFILFFSYISEYPPGPCLLLVAGGEVTNGIPGSTNDVELLDLCPGQGCQITDNVPNMPVNFIMAGVSYFCEWQVKFFKSAHMKNRLQ